MRIICRSRILLGPRISLDASSWAGMLLSPNLGRGKDLSEKVERRTGKTTHPHRDKDGGIKEARVAAPHPLKAE